MSNHERKLKVSISIIGTVMVPVDIKCQYLFEGTEDELKAFFKAKDLDKGCVSGIQLDDNLSRVLDNAKEEATSKPPMQWKWVSINSNYDEAVKEAEEV